jgi:hypothetical protein
LVVVVVEMEMQGLIQPHQEVLEEVLVVLVDLLLLRRQELRGKGIMVV